MKELATAKENQFRPRYDAEGYVIGGTMTRDKDGGLEFLRLARQARTLYPMIEIVMDGPVDADGRALSVLEQYGKAHLIAEQTQIARDVAADNSDYYAGEEAA